MSDRVALDAAYVRRQIDALKVAHPELAEDAELLASTIEGETDFHNVMARVVDAFLDAMEMKSGADQRLEAVRARRDQASRKADAMKALALDLMKTADEPLIRLPEATLSLRPGSESVEVDDLASLPQGMWERMALKAEIAKALKDGEAVPGAHLQRGETTLSIRTK